MMVVVVARGGGRWWWSMMVLVGVDGGGRSLVLMLVVAVVVGMHVIFYIFILFILNFSQQELLYLWHFAVFIDFAAMLPKNRGPPLSSHSEKRS